MAVKIIGLGPGSPDYILPKAVEEMESSHVILGFQRAITSLEHIERPKKIVGSIGELLDYIENNPNQEIGIVASGDPGFYGILDYIKKNIKGEISVIPGISSFQYFMSRLKKSWQEAYTGSLHGREVGFIEVVKTYPISIWLTDKIQNPGYICKELVKQAEDYWVYVGENLSYPNEKIIQGRPKDLIKKTWADLSLVVVEQKARD